MLKTIGYDVGFQKGQGQYLFDRDGDRYLDLLSGFGVFAIGRNHPSLREALKACSTAISQSGSTVSTLAGVLAERLLEHVPYLDKVFFANSGAETVEAAIKFARGATGRPGIVSCSHSFHGLSYGALSLMDDANFRSGFSRCRGAHRSNDLALEQALSSRQVAAFIVEPIQGKGVNLPTDEFLPGAAAVQEIRHHLHCRRNPDRHRPHRKIPRGRALECRARHGAAGESAVAGHVPVGALLTRKHLRQDLQPDGPRGRARLDLCENDLAMPPASQRLT